MKHNRLIPGKKVFIPAKKLSLLSWIKIHAKMLNGWIANRFFPVD
jgi:hypothetical protein